MRRDGRFHDGFYNGRFVAWFFCSVAGIDSLANKRRRVTGKQGHALATPKGGLCFMCGRLLCAKKGVFLAREITIPVP
jgi:hypothetical protein